MMVCGVPKKSINKTDVANLSSLASKVVINTIKHLKKASAIE
jgi:hypothetical protein